MSLEEENTHDILEAASVMVLNDATKMILELKKSNQALREAAKDFIYKVDHSKAYPPSFSFDSDIYNKFKAALSIGNLK